MVRDFLFNREDRFVTDRPTGWAWGRRELDPARFTIIRIDAPAAIVAGLRNRTKMLSTKGNYSGSHNIWLDATVKDAPADEALVIGYRYINLRSASVDTSEEDAWANAQDGDYVFVTKQPGSADSIHGVLIYVKSVSPRRIIRGDRMTLGEATLWRT